MTTPAEFAAMLNGRSAGHELTSEEEKSAKRSGLVVVFGASDDRLVFRGSIHDELDCFRGGTCRVDVLGVISHRAALDSHMAILEYADRCRRSVDLRAIWNNSVETQSPVWSYEFAPPHSTFEVLSGGSVCCRGIVFCLADIEAHFQPTMQLAIASDADDVPDWLDDDRAEKLRESLREGSWDRERSALILRFDGEVEVYFDGGEPEDATFGRDYAWVEGAILRAYEAGRAAAYSQIRAEYEASVRFLTKLATARSLEG